MKAPLPDQVVVDDSVLLADRLLRTLHRNPDGHLHSFAHGHEKTVSKEDNVAILYIYTCDADGLYTVYEHYVYSDTPHSYKEWNKLAQAEAAKVAKSRIQGFYGVYGWQTGFVQITPLRSGDLLIKIDEQGARGVRLSFGARKTKRKASAGS